MYKEFYGLTEKPFELLPDPKFFFLTPCYRAIIASVIDGIKNRKGFISIIGEVGTGKTTLIRYLLGKLETEEKVKTVLIFHPTITFKELLKTILLELDLTVTSVGKKALLNQLQDYLTQMIARDETLVVLIDEAQDLSREVMGELGMLAKTEALQIVFVGQPEFEDKLHSQGLRQLEQRIRVRHQILLFTGEESKDYIDHRLHLVGSSSSQRFTPKAISLICSHARGIPRLINLMGDHALFKGYRLSREKIDEEMIREVIHEMEGPVLRKTLLSPMAAGVKGDRLSALRSSVLMSRVSLIVLGCLGLGGFFFLIDRYVQPRPAKTMDIHSLESPSVDTQLSLQKASTSPQKGENSEREVHQQRGETTPLSHQIPEPISPPKSPLPLTKGEDRMIETITVKRGYTLSSLARDYYHMVNPTLMDLILDSNPDIKDIHLILVDQKIKLPEITDESLVIKTPEETYKMNVGTFPRSDSARFYRDEQILKGKKIEILPRRVSPHEIWYRVIIGDFDSLDEAERTIRILKERDLLPAFGGLSKIK